MRRSLVGNTEAQRYETIFNYFEWLPATTHVIDISRCDLLTCPPLTKFTQLKRFTCEFNRFTELPELPDSLEILVCYSNKLKRIRRFPTSLRTLDAAFNHLESLPDLPPKLGQLDVRNNHLQTLPSLHRACLHYLNVKVNSLKQLPPLPPTLLEIFCDFNRLQTLPPLPESLFVLSCKYNPITPMPHLPANLYEMKLEGTRIHDSLLQLHTSPHIMQKRILNRLHHIRVMYYTRKYGWVWRNLLWLKVRLPKALQANHPDRLQQALQTTEDLEEVMDTFGKVF